LNLEPKLAEVLAELSIAWQQGRAALHSGRSNCPWLSSVDTDLQAVIAAWESLPKLIRRAIVELTESKS